jgi:predicted dehydrogenase
MKILILGFGSIGKRHYRNLLELGYKSIQVYDPNDLAFAEFENVERLKKISTTSIKEYDIAFICSPNSLHIKQAIICAKAGCDLFIEKPLSLNKKGIKKLIKICFEKKLITLVGCNMRFHPCLMYIKKVLDKKVLGRIYSIRHEFGSYLPSWRPGQDYSKNFAAKKETGGGVILDDIHEYDLLFWLNDFSKIRKASFVYNKVSDLKIETEDMCLAAYEFNNRVLGLVASDYLQQRYARNCKIISERGTLTWDFLENIVWLKDSKKEKKLFLAKKFTINRMYIDELKYFMDCQKKRKATFNNVTMAYNTLSNILNYL